jgi:hypothetical protein
MKKVWRSTLATAAILGAVTSVPAQAESISETLQPTYDALSNKGEGYDLSDSILGPDSAYDFGGWLAAGYSSQKTGQFNTYGGVELTQAWLYASKALDASEGFDWGFRADLMVGADGPDTQSFGNNPGQWDFDNSTQFDGTSYGLANPQLYVELGYKDFKIKGGHFYTPVGYEVVTAPDNFFFSHALTMYYGEPFTHTGAVATYTGLEGVEVFGGWTAGWDTGFDQFNGGSNFLGGLSVQATDWAKITYTATGGDLGWIGEGYSHSVVGDFTVTEKLKYIFQTDYVDTDQKAGAEYETVGVNQYLIYDLTEKVSVGGRAEWFRANTTDYYNMTTGVNVQLLPNLKIRPEFRYQFSPEVEDGEPNTIGIPVDQAAFAVDAILTF